MKNKIGSFVIADPNKCTGCRACEVACFTMHNQHNNVGYTVGTVDIPVIPRLYLVKGDNFCMPIQCRHCEDAPCAKACPNGGIVRVGNTIKINEENCIGCKTCMLACPIGAIDIVTLKDVDEGKLCFRERMTANKCDFCIESPEGPSCVNVCPTKAFTIVKDEDIDSKVKNKRKLAIL